VAPAFSLLHCFRHRLSKLMLKLSYKMLGMRALTKQYGVGHSDDLAFIFPFRQTSFPLQLSGQRVLFETW
jgi:hypothetical protein